MFDLLKKAIRKIIKPFAYLAKRILISASPIDQNTIMFLTYQGDYTCNPKAIAEELIQRKTKYKLYWVINKSSNLQKYPPELILVMRGSFKFYVAAGRAKIFIDNTHNLFRLGVHKKKGQILMQTWHGSLGIKRLDGQVVMGKHWERIAKRSKEYTDYCISNSSFETDVFQSSYWENVPILLYGHARNDLLFSTPNDHEQIRNKVFESLKIQKDSKVLLYAPTHRDGNDKDVYQLNYSSLKRALEQHFGGDWVILLRLHSRLRSSITDNAKLPSYVIDATNYDDIQELMIATDVGLTDYSSWIFDYILLKRPGFILASDLDQYTDSRSFYYPIETTPFPIASTNEQLEESILNFNRQEYDQKVEAFLKERGCIEDGLASKRIVDQIEKLLNQ